MFDLMTALYVYVLDAIEPRQYEEVLPTMKRYMDDLIEASEQKRYREVRQERPPVRADAARDVA